MYETVDDIAPEVVEAGATVPVPTIENENSSSSPLQTKSTSKSELSTRFDAVQTTLPSLHISLNLPLSLKTMKLEPLLVLKFGMPLSAVDKFC